MRSQTRRNSSSFNVGNISNIVSAQSAKSSKLWSVFFASTKSHTLFIMDITAPLVASGWILRAVRIFVPSSQACSLVALNRPGADILLKLISIDLVWCSCLSFNCEESSPSLTDRLEDNLSGLLFIIV